MDKGIWFDWHKGSFLIRTPSIELILDLNSKVEDGELDKEDAMKRLFESCLGDWKGVNGQREYPRETVIQTIWDHVEARTFIVDRMIELLGLKVDSKEKKVTVVERILLNAGLLKS